MTSAQNWHERTGLALGDAPNRFESGQEVRADGAVLRYLDAVEAPGGYRLYWEAERADGSHDLRTDFVSRR